MSLAGLILTDDDGQSEGGMPRALLTIAGQPLIEYQARIARAAGAGHIVVLVDQLPTALVEAFDRLREDGIAIDVARTARDAADRIHPEERVVLMAAGVIASASALATHTKSTGPLVLTVPASERSQHLERIDGDCRWTGLALIPGSVLRTTAEMLGDWALAPTLLRAAMQHGAQMITDEDVRLVRDASEARQASLALIGGGEKAGGLGRRWAIAPVVALAMPWLIGRRVPFGLLAAMPLICLLLAALSAFLVWPFGSAALLLLGSLIAEAARRMAVAGGRATRLVDWYSRLRSAAWLLIAGSAGWMLLSGGAGWGPLALALWGGVALHLQPSDRVLRGWMADPESAVLLLLVALAAGAPLAGLGLVLVHAVVTQFALVRLPG